MRRSAPGRGRDAAPSASSLVNGTARHRPLVPALEPHPGGAKHVDCRPHELDNPSKRTDGLTQPRLRPCPPPALVLIHRLVPPEHATLRVMSEAEHFAASPPIAGAWDSLARPGASTTPAPAPHHRASSWARRRLSLQAAHQRRTIDPDQARPIQSSPHEEPTQAGRAVPGAGSNSGRQGRCVRPERRHAKTADRRAFRPNEPSARQLAGSTTPPGPATTPIRFLQPSACLSLLVRRERQRTLSLTGEPQACLSLTPPRPVIHKTLTPVAGGRDAGSVPTGYRFATTVEPALAADRREAAVDSRESTGIHRAGRLGSLDRSPSGRPIQRRADQRANVTARRNQRQHR